MNLANPYAFSRFQFEMSFKESAHSEAFGLAVIEEAEAKRVREGLHNTHHSVG